MDIVKIDTVLQEMNVVDIAGVTVTTREATAIGMRTGSEEVVVADGVAAEMVIGIAAAEEGTTTITAADPQGMTTTVDETAVVMMILERLAGVTETMDLHMATVAAAEARAEMEWVRLNEGPRRLKAQCRCPRESGKPLVGMFTLRDTSSIVQCRQSRLVRARYIRYYFWVMNAFLSRFV